MRILCLAVVIGFLSVTSLGQDQSKMIPVPANVSIELPNFSIRLPSSDGWLMTKPDVNAVDIRFENRQQRAGIAVNDVKLTKPVANVEEKLTELSRNVEKRFAEHGKVILSEHSVDSRPGAQCLHQQIIIDSPELKTPGSGASKMAVHTLQCIYGPEHQGLVTVQYLYPVQGSDDPQKK